MQNNPNPNRPPGMYMQPHIQGQPPMYYQQPPQQHMQPQQGLSPYMNGVPGYAQPGQMPPSGVMSNPPTMFTPSASGNVPSGEYASGPNTLNPPRPYLPSGSSPSAGPYQTGGPPSGAGMIAPPSAGSQTSYGTYMSPSMQPIQSTTIQMSSPANVFKSNNKKIETEVINPSMHTTAKFLEKTRRNTEIIVEATKFAYSKIQKWIDYVHELQEQAKLFERQMSTPISKPSNLMLDDLLDLDGVIDQAFQKVSLAPLTTQKVAEARNEHNELEIRIEKASKAEGNLQYRLNEKRQEIETEIQKIDEELADLEALCTALGCHQEFEAIVSINGSR